MTNVYRIAGVGVVFLCAGAIILDLFPMPALGIALLILGVFCIVASPIGMD